MSDPSKTATSGSALPKWKRNLFIETVQEEAEDEDTNENPSISYSPAKGENSAFRHHPDLETQSGPIRTSCDASSRSLNHWTESEINDRKIEIQDQDGSNSVVDIEAPSVNDFRMEISVSPKNFLSEVITETSHPALSCSPGSPSATKVTTGNHPGLSSSPGAARVTFGSQSVATVPTTRKERSSWDFQADDSFQYESGASVPEPEEKRGLPVSLQPGDHDKIDLKAKLPQISELTPPASPDEAIDAHAPSQCEEDSVASPADSVGELSALPSQRKPPRSGPRLKTRLQDPPPVTPAVSNQLANMWSDPARTRRPSMNPTSLKEEPSTSKFGPAAGRRYTAALTSSENEQLQNLIQSRMGQKSTLELPATTSEKPPEKTTSILKMFSPSVMFSPSRLGLLSKSKANIQPVPEEEPDPLDDDSIPKYKKLKKRKQRWLVWIQWIGLFFLIVVLIFAIKLNKLQMVIWKQIKLWQWLALATVIISGRLIASWVVMILVAAIEHHYILKKRVLYFVYGLRRSVKNVIWLAQVIGVWKLVFRHVEYEGNVPIVTKVLWCLFTTACLWMVKILVVKVAANSFHRAAYFDRVQDCLFHQYVLETLSTPRTDDLEEDVPSLKTSEKHVVMRLPEEQQHVSPQEIRNANNIRSSPSRMNLNVPQNSNYTPPDSNQGSPTRSRLGPASPPPYPSNLKSMRMPSRLNMPPQAQASKIISTSPQGRPMVNAAPQQQLSGILAPNKLPIHQEKLQELTSETVSAWTMKRLMKIVQKTNMTTFSSLLDQEAGSKIDSEAQAKAAAKQIFYNVARPGEKSLSLSDFLNFLPEDQATRAFSLFEVNDQGRITKKALVKWVVNIYKERRALALTLSDNRTVVAKLHRVLDVLLLAVAGTICFLIMGVSTQKLIVGFSSVLLPSVFVFGNSARSTFESLIFLFVMHPFDVGDRICVEGIPMIVEEMNILNTILLSGSNEKIYYPNAVLATKPISNFYRSPNMWESIDFQIHASTPVEQLGLLKERMTKYIESLPQFWCPTFRIVCKDVEDSTRMKMALWVQHTMNYQESGERWQRRSNILLHLKTQLQDMGIGFHLPRQEIMVTGIPVLDVPSLRVQPSPM